MDQTYEVTCSITVTSEPRPLSQDFFLGPKETMKSRAWCLTVNNYTDDDVAVVTKISHEAAYAVVGIEKGDQGTPHLQGYMYFKTQRHFTALHKAIPRAHLEVAKANAEKNTEYCTKEGNVLLQHGDMPKQGKRTDLEVAREAVKDGQCMRSIADTVSSLQAVRAAQTLFTLLEPVRSWKPEVRWYYGPSGKGKTRTAHDWLGPDLYQPTNMKWWDGYDGHEHVLLDDFRPRQCDFVYLLRLLDRYGMRVECKGGSRQLRARKIAITSIQSPETMMWFDEEPIEQLMRRIDQIILVEEYIEDGQTQSSPDEPYSEAQEDDV